MTRPTYQLQQPLDAIIFDCDGTLTRLEGINELAAMNGVGAEITALTEKAMGATGLTLALYQQRLDVVRPTLQQLIHLGQLYIQETTPDTQSVIAILQNVQKPIYIVSAGMNPAVQLFAEFLSVPSAHVYAVDLEFDAEGDYQGFDRQSVLTHTGGKRVVIQQILQVHPRALLVGDGINDVEASDVVERFVGYGGVFYRENIAKQSDFYIDSESMAPLLPLSLTEDEVKQLSSAQLNLYQQGLELLRSA